MLLLFVCLLLLLVGYMVYSRLVERAFITVAAALMYVRLWVKASHSC